ncbi:helix-turn-helix transcriptional regulator [Loigolactobacillus jiayinensis]|uniref:Helix-turn-helix transcriptional regulator n=1 Tax=Loigolactobacillus jiayinensis TaxID=2486016 RepID=A0ABW1RGF9_9LACO|nr:WYL domain-containing protein [Loigolactobacillus jiayinensis]
MVAQGKKVSSGDSIKRVVNLLLRLEQGEKFTRAKWREAYMKELSEQKQKNGVKYDPAQSDRTFQRDLAHIKNGLKETGFQLKLYRKAYADTDINQRYEYQLAAENVETGLVNAIAIAQIIIASRAFKKGHLTVENELQQVLDTLKVTLTPNQQQRFDKAISRAIGSYEPLKYPQLLGYLGQILDAIAKHQRLVFMYKKGAAASVAQLHNAQPETIFFDVSYFYVVMRYANEAQPKLFRLDRITEIQKITAGEQLDLDTHFKLKEFRHEAVLLAMGQLTTFRFICRIPPQIALDRFPGAKIISKPNSPAIIIQARAYEKGATMWLMSQGKEIELIYPSDFVKRFKQEVKATFEQYD